jgi:intein-encoded DNA endonuclease-like protein
MAKTWQYRGKMRFMESTTLAYIAGFLDGDGSIFFQIVPRKDYKRKFQIRSSIAFYQKTRYVEILEWLKEVFK